MIDTMNMIKVIQHAEANALEIPSQRKYTQTVPSNDGRETTSQTRIVDAEIVDKYKTTRRDEDKHQRTTARKCSTTVMPKQYLVESKTTKMGLKIGRCTSRNRNCV